MRLGGWIGIAERNAVAHDDVRVVVVLRVSPVDVRERHAVGVFPLKQCVQCLVVDGIDVDVRIRSRTQHPDTEQEVGGQHEGKPHATCGLQLEQAEQHEDALHHNTGIEQCEAGRTQECARCRCQQLLDVPEHSSGQQHGGRAHADARPAIAQSMGHRSQQTEAECERQPPQRVETVRTAGDLQGVTEHRDAHRECDRGDVEPADAGERVSQQE